MQIEIFIIFPVCSLSFNDSVSVPILCILISKSLLLLVNPVCVKQRIVTGIYFYKHVNSDIASPNQSNYPSRPYFISAFYLLWLSVYFFFKNCNKLIITVASSIIFMLTELEIMMQVIYLFLVYHIGLLL